MPQPSAGATREHWVGLDGLRAIAVGSVMVFHATPLGIAANGYVGVDVFFVLSGFLITSLLLREQLATGQINLINFYARRILRLLPALLACTGALLALSIASHRLAVMGPALVTTLLYAANWWQYTGHPMPLLEHTWTLAVEEHFYLAWPALLLLRRRREIFIGLLLLLLICLAVPWGWLDAVRGTYLRGAPIALGCALALFRSRLPRIPTILGALALLVLTLIAFAPIRLPESLMGGPLGIPGYLTAVVLMCTVDGRLRVLNWQPAVWVGRRAYGLYLYHMPLVSLAIHQVTGGTPLLRAVAALLASFLVAALSYRFVEAPFLRLKARFSSERRPQGEGSRTIQPAERS